MVAGVDDPPAPLPVEVVADDELGPIDRALLAAAPDAVAARLTRRDGVRVTAADAYLAGIGADRLAAVAGAVERVVVAGGRATGVVLGDGVTVDADAVVLCAGAIGTPGVLLRSGLGGPAVGAGLRNHPGVPVLLRRRRPADDVHALVTGALLRRGDVHVLALDHLGPDEPGWGMLLAVLMTSTSRGVVRLGEGGAEEPEWELDARDRARLARAALVATGLAEHDAFGAVVDEVEIGDGPAGVFHWSSTCAVGRVVDERGAVHGVERPVRRRRVGLPRTAERPPLRPDAPPGGEDRRRPPLTHAPDLGVPVPNRRSGCAGSRRPGTSDSQNEPVAPPDRRDRGSGGRGRRRGRHLLRRRLLGRGRCERWTSAPWSSWP